MKTARAAGFLVIGAMLMGGGVRAYSGDPAPAKPTDKYIKLLDGKSLEEGRGFAGVVEFGMSLAQLKENLGPGTEPGPLWPGWHVYDKGPWPTVIVYLRPQRHFSRHREPCPTCCPNQSFVGIALP